MSASLVLVVVMAVLYAAGIYIMLERNLTRVLIGFLLVGNATNILLFLMSGRAGEAPFLSDGQSGADTVDALPQALILTAIVINFGLSALFLGLIYRSWWLARLGTEGDTVPDQHADETPEQAEETFRATSEDEEAIHEAIEASERDDEGSLERERAVVEISDDADDDVEPARDNSGRDRDDTAHDTPGRDGTGRDGSASSASADRDRGERP